MSRSLVTVRSAEVADAPFLVELWADVLRRADPAELLADVEAVVKEAAVSPEQRLLVAEYDGERAGGVLLRTGTVTPINLEPVLQVISPHVAVPFRRRGVGRALMDCAIGFAEELGVAHVMTGVTSGSRESNRFMARLALGPARDPAARPGLGGTGPADGTAAHAGGSGRQRAAPDTGARGASFRAPLAGRRLSPRAPRGRSLRSGHRRFHRSFHRCPRCRCGRLG